MKDEQKKNDQQVEEQDTQVEESVEEQEEPQEEVSKEQEYLHGWKRALADYENLKKNLGSEKQAERNRLKISLAHELLPVIDNFEQAITHLPELTPEEEKKLENWLTGVKFIKKQFEDVMASLGITPIESLTTFDPNMHEASGEETDESKGDGEILRVLQSGWKMGETVIRPAKVILNKLETK